MNEHQELFAEYAVSDVETVEQFLKRYYKPRRMVYCYDALLQSHQRDFDTLGIDWISHHDSVTGEIVALLNPNFKEN